MTYWTWRSTWDHPPYKNLLGYNIAFQETLHVLSFLASLWNCRTKSIFAQCVVFSNEGRVTNAMTRWIQGPGSGNSFFLNLNADLQLPAG